MKTEREKALESALRELLALADHGLGEVDLDAEERKMLAKAERILNE